jgi:hypothetical protein
MKIISLTLCILAGHLHASSMTLSPEEFKRASGGELLSNKAVTQKPLTTAGALNSDQTPSIGIENRAQGKVEPSESINAEVENKKSYGIQRLYPTKAEWCESNPQACIQSPSGVMQPVPGKYESTESSGAFKSAKSEQEGLQITNAQKQNPRL